MGLKLYAIIAAAILLAGVVGYGIHIKGKADERDAAVAELASATAQFKADVAALQAAHAHERKIATEASTDYENRLQALSVARDATPVRSVRLCTSPTGWVPAPSPAASGVSAPGDAGHAGPPGLHPGYGSGLQTGEVDRFSDSGPELGPQLYGLADEKDEQLAQCAALQGWVKAR